MSGENLRGGPGGVVCPIDLGGHLKKNIHIRLVFEDTTKCII